MSGDRLMGVEEAQSAVLAGCTPLDGTERCPPADALGRILAEPVVSATALPPWDNSAMDGYALRAADTAGAREDGPVRLAVTGEAAAGTAS
jgi:molybdopterin molybdotransferase